MTNLIEIKGVTHAYRTPNGPLPVLEDLTLSVPEGEFAAVVGPSGCGKSTLTRLVAGLMKPDTGEVWLHGERVRSPRKTVGMAFQNPVMLEWRTILENVILPLEIVAPSMPRAQRRARAMELLELVGLAGFENKRPSELSGGMRQRASLCRAIVHRPDVLIMDEPFGALDEIVRDHLNEQLLRLWARTQKTIAFVTHSIPEAVYLSTKIVVMSPRPGRIADVIDSPLPKERPLDIRETPEFLEIAHRVREGLRAGHADD